jgi:hypothetical protein
MSAIAWWRGGKAAPPTFRCGILDQQKGHMMDNGLLTDRRALLGLMTAGVAAFAASEAHAETTVVDNPMKLSPAWHSA